MSKRSSQDCISALPDALLLHVLSFMGMKDVVRSSILSKRWRYLWTCVPTLRFEFGETSLEKVGKFVEWVNRTLLLCNNNSSNAIEKFVVDFWHNGRFASDVDKWVGFAAERMVGEMSLRLLSTWPQSLSCISSLTRLSIHACKFIPNRSLSWASLKTLKISLVKLNDGVISEICSASPGLEYLNLDECWGVDGLDVKHETLKELVISSWSNEPYPFGISLEISAPKLQNLQISGQFRQIRLKNVSSLRKAELSLPFDFPPIEDDYDLLYNFFIQLSRSLHHVEELQLCVRCIQCLSQFQFPLEDKGLLSPLSRLKCLKLKTKINKYDIPGIISLLRCSPNLEKLVVSKIQDYLLYPITRRFSNQVETYWKLVTRIEKFPLPHLKTVKFSGFNKLGDVDGHVITLLRALVENANLVGGIVINMGEYQMSIMPRDLLSIR